MSLFLGKPFDASSSNLVPFSKPFMRVVGTKWTIGIEGFSRLTKEGDDPWPWLSWPWYDHGWPGPWPLTQQKLFNTDFGFFPIGGLQEAFPRRGL